MVTFTERKVDTNTTLSAMNLFARVSLPSLSIFQQNTIPEKTTQTDKKCVAFFWQRLPLFVRFFLSAILDTTASYSIRIFSNFVEYSYETVVCKLYEDIR